MAVSIDGFCSIKAEYVIKRKETPLIEESNETPPKKPKLADEENQNAKDEKKKEDRKKFRGQNKSRPKPVRQTADSLPCSTIVNVHPGEEKKQCTYKGCIYMHDPVEYLKNKPSDIVTDESSDCYVFETRGECPRGIACRYGSAHITPEGFNMVNKEKKSEWIDSTSNLIEFNSLIKLQRRKYDLSAIEDMVNDVNKSIKERKSNQNGDNKIENGQATSGAITDEDIIKTRSVEKKVLDWKDKLYLGPLTTLGNLPFRRICKEFGADITCGEMAMCDALLKGAKQEWALVKRHACEDMFGVQICGSNAFTISKAVHVIQSEIKVDFIDLNLGCPIDFVYKKGAGCGMLLRTNTLEASVNCASKILNVPFTVKTRVGVHQDTRVAHQLAPKFFEWGASMLTVHGRSREQRYTKLSDWEYINECAKAASPNPVYGNGDILSYDDYVSFRARAPETCGVMICRGGLIKPWLFTEIKEKRLWDIRSSERFDILKKYVNYGLEHWGSDSRGVENTRRFLLEWCSFLYRYIPVGLLERPPQRINERPPYYMGRDDLETLMASSNCADWIKISEMLLGPVPENFQFLPKHKANSY